MTFTIEIRPRFPFGTDKENRMGDAQVLAKEIGEIDGVEKTEVLESIQKAGVLEEPVVVAALITGTATAAVAFITCLFQLLKKRRENGKHEAVSIQINNIRFHLADSTETFVKEQIKKMIEEADRRNEKKISQMNERQRSILKILARYKGEPIDLEEVRQEYGSFALVQFMRDWKGLLDEGLVLGVPVTVTKQIVTGTGSITPRGEGALRQP